VIANLHGTQLKTWYYRPSQVKRWSRDNFKFIASRPVGITLPPSYLETFFSKRKNFLMQLSGWEKRLHSLSILSGMSDHYVIDLQLK
jgi:hypothetical protein